MNTAIYLAKNNVWVGDKSYPLADGNLKSVLEQIKKDFRIGTTRLILGDDVSYVTSYKSGDEILNRQNVLRTARGWFPVEIDENYFDWKKIVLPSGEEWVQVVAVDKNYWEGVCRNVKDARISIDLVVPVGVLVGGGFGKRDTPVVIKWTGKENLTILTFNGLTDLVVAGDKVNEVNEYEKQKWHLAINPEMVILDEKEFNLTEKIYGLKTKGEDDSVLTIPLLKKFEVLLKDEDEMPKLIVKGLPLETEESKIETNRRIDKKLIIFVPILLLILGGVIYWANKTLSAPAAPTTNKSVITPGVTRAVVQISTVSATLSPTSTLMPTPAIDFGKYTIQVLNGSGIAGEAATVRDKLIAIGFINVDIGNGPASTETIISVKTGLETGVISLAQESVTNFTVGKLDTLTTASKYDLVIVLGSIKK